MGTADCVKTRHIQFAASCFQWFAPVKTHQTSLFTQSAGSILSRSKLKNPARMSADHFCAGKCGSGSLLCDSRAVLKDD
jgi:hypothetical protein